MRTLKTNWLTIILFLLLNICILFAVNYALGYIMNGEYMPYGLSRNHLELVRDDQSIEQLKDIIEIDNYDNLIMIAEVEDSNYIGLLDLQNKYYTQSTKAIYPIAYRYFSKDDYISGARVGVLVNHCDFFDVESVKSGNVAYQLDEVLNCLESPNLMAYPINSLQNIFSIDFSEVSRVFVDSTDIEEINTVKFKLKEHGFISADKDHNISIFGAILYSLQGGRYQQFLITAGISVFILYNLMLFIHFWTHKSYIRISRIVGGTLKSMLPSTLILTGVLSLLLSSLSYLIIVYFKYFGTNYISFVSFGKVSIFLLLSNLFFVTINLILHNKSTQNLMGRL